MQGSTSKTLEYTNDLSESSDADGKANNTFSFLSKGSGLSSSDRYEYSEREQEETGGDAEFERTAISCFRYFIVFLMISGTIAAGVGSYFYFEEQEDAAFEKEFVIITEDIKHLSYDRLSQRVDEFRSLASTITGMAINSKSSWPYFTDESYAMIVSNFMEKTGSGMIFLSPFVHDIEKDSWSNYTQSHQHWISDTLAFQQVPRSDNLTATAPFIFRVSVGDKIPEEGAGPFLPIWQSLPVASSAVNFNLRSDPHYSAFSDTVLETKEPAMTDLLGFSSQGLGELLGTRMQQLVRARPFSLFLQPVFKDSTEEEVVAILNSDVNWLLVFSLKSDKKLPPVHVVVDDGCDITFTMKVAGKDSDFVGFGDYHEPAYEYLGTEFPFAPAVTTQHMLGESECTYIVRVYPTTEFWDAYHLKYPAITAGVIASIFAFMCLILYLYDSAVRMRQRRLLSVAARSEQILSVLYPKSIRDRMFGVEKKDEGRKRAQKMGIRTKQTEDDVVKTSRFQLKSFIKSDRHGEASDSFQSKPIADLFLDSTVLFADIAGFTAWSSTREPSQVFTLLETIYRAFDIVAKRRRVFKVETIGDCYVAVTGLPEPAKDHAGMMASFAREIVDRFCDLVGTLETTLGPDTGELGIRIGMHSGPITAGVLRGDKSRFQLFGDTVNTCARIEASGMRNRIHVSHETAYLIGLAGRGHLLRSRDEQVTAKGKGKLQTYWLLTREEEEIEIASAPGDLDDIDTSIRSALPEDFGNAKHADVERHLSPKLRRLCQWNVDVLTKSLKQIVAHRMASNAKAVDFDSALDEKEDQIMKQTFILDEVVEIIPLPEFDQEVHKRQKDVNKIELPDVVIEQIRLYVSSIALMYRKNPFHNFEHASHVAMSVSKLLSRIVAADDILNADDSVRSHDIAGSIHDHTYGITSDPMTRFSVILAALVHDVDHIGISNAQMVKDEHMLAKQFRNKSVAEQNSTFLAWELLMEPRFKEFRRTIYAAPFELDRFRQLIANTVLATDIMDKELQTLRKKRWETAFSDTASTAFMTTNSRRDIINRKATIVIEHLIQASDVAHTMQHWHIYRKWNERLFEEMVKAYKRGKLAKNPADFWFEGEIGFFDFYVIPLAKKLKDCGVFGVSSDEYLNYAMANRQEWEEKGQAFVAEMAEKYADILFEEDDKQVFEGLNLLL